MSRQALKILDTVLSGAETLGRKDAIKLLEYFGFQHRKCNSNHDRWTHQPTGVIFQCSRRKLNQPLWGFQMKDFRTAIEQVLAKAKKQNDDEKKQEIKPVKTATVKTQLPVEPIAPATPVICIGAKNYPDAVAELVYAYENKEISAEELAKDLNQSGYRTPSGQPFEGRMVYAYLVKNNAYKRWKERQQMQLVKPAVQPTVTEAAPKVDPKAVLQSITDLVARNDELEAENALLRKQLDAVRGIVCG